MGKLGQGGCGRHVYSGCRGKVPLRSEEAVGVVGDKAIMFIGGKAVGYIRNKAYTEGSLLIRDGGIVLEICGMVSLNQILQHL